MTETETPSDMWFYVHENWQKILYPPNTFKQVLTSLEKNDSVRNIGKSLMNILRIGMGPPPASDSKEPTPAEGKAPEKTPENQSGGNLFCHTNDKFTYYRLESYNELMSYLSENNVRISLLTKQLLKKMYLYHYTLDYVKALNYILFKVKQYSFPPKLGYILSNVFDQIGNKIYNTMNV